MSLSLIKEIWEKVMCQFQAETSRAGMIHHFHTPLVSKSVKASLAFSLSEDNGEEGLCQSKIVLSHWDLRVVCYYEGANLH